MGDNVISLFVRSSFHNIIWNTEDMTEDTDEYSYRIVQCTESLLQRMARHEFYETNQSYVGYSPYIHINNTNTTSFFD